MTTPGEEWTAISVRDDVWEAYPMGHRETVRLHLTRLSDRKLEASSADVRAEFGSATPTTAAKTK